MRSRILGFASLGLVAFATSAAYAEPGYATPRPARTGLELGAGLQVGEISCASEGEFCNDFTEAGGLNLNASYFLTPSFGLTLDLWGMSHRDDDFTFSHYVNTVGVKLRPVSILTFTAGIGAAHASVDYMGLIDARYESEDAFAIMGAVTLDLLRARSWALSVEARFGTGFYGEDDDADTADVIGRNAGVGAAFTFFGF